MPLRFTPTSAALTAHLPAPTAPSAATAAAWSCHRFFHASPRALRLEATSSSANHYETLNVHPTASPAEIKKSFYHLSKRHHPDHNPTDPHAPTRFMRLSEAYAVLSHADKRARYDRHHGHHHPNTAGGGERGGSYHSTGPGTGPAGGRPASGLSRRRGTYQGPPPSFYRSGGWGAHGAKRRAAHEESTGGSGAGVGSGLGSGFGTAGAGQGYRYGYGYAAGPGTGGGSGVGAGPPPPPPPGAPPPGSGGMGAGGMGGYGFGGGAGGMGPGQDPYGHRDDVPHFDHEAHERAQRRGDERRAHKLAREKGVNIDQPETGTAVSFLGVAAILAVVVMGPFVINGWRSNRAGKAGEKEKEKGNNNNNKQKEKETRGR